MNILTEHEQFQSFEVALVALKSPPQLAFIADQMDLPEDDLIALRSRLEQQMDYVP